MRTSARRSGSVSAPLALGRFRRSLAAVTALAVVAVGLGATARPAPAADPVAGQEFSLPYYSEPEFLLVAGSERWNVRNRPDGSMAAAYGHPEDATHDTYMATAREADLGADATRTPVDISYRSPEAGSRSLAHTWNFVRYDDGTSEAWGPVETGRATRHPVVVPGRTIVGGMVLSDLGGAPRSLVVTDDAGLHLVTADGASLVGDVGEAFAGPDTARAAVARESTEFGNAAVQLGEHGLIDRTAVRDLMVVLLGSGELVPIRIDDADFEILPSLSTLVDGEELVADPLTLPLDGPLVMDLDFTCSWYQDSPAAGHENGQVSDLLFCPSGSRDPGSERMSGGRLSIAIGSRVSDAPPGQPAGFRPAVRIVTAADAAVGSGSGPRQITDNHNGFACILDQTDPPMRAGSFDVRTVAGVTHAACVRPVGDQSEIRTYLQPQEYHYVNNFGQNAEDPALRVPRFSTQSSPLVRRTFDELYQAGPGEVSAGVPVIEETYADLQSLTVALQFPCETLLQRPLGDQTYLPSCEAVTQAGAAGAGWVSYTVAGYGTVDGVPSTFVQTRPHEALLEEVLRDRDVPSPSAQVDRYSFGVEPAAYYATDLEQLRTDLESTDASAFDEYRPPALDSPPPPLLLSHVPARSRAELTFRILSTAPTTKTVPGNPIAVLQAPPTVRGLGQQTTFTPEFGATSSVGNGTAISKSTRMGGHAGIEATVTVGVGFLGNNARIGGGAAFEYGFMNEITNELETTVTREQTESYGGSFADHTVVTQSFVQDVWTAEVLTDPSGLATGDIFEYSVPRGSVEQSILLSDLAEQQPALYGENGLYRPSIDRMLPGVVGDPGTYFPGAGSPEPESIVGATGPCIGGHADPGNPTPFPDGLPAAVSPENPYFTSNPPDPVGSSIAVSAEHVVSVGNDLTEGATITYSEATAKSQLTSKSNDFALSAIAKVESEISGGLALALEVTMKAGINAGFSTGADISEELGTGSGLSTVLGNIPHVPDGPGHWLDRESYSWRMFMCKAPLGPAGLRSEVWLQGYVVDGYSADASHGIDELAPVDSVEPVAAAVALADTTPSAAGPEDCVGGQAVDGNRFRWAHPAGTVQRYDLRIENITSGGSWTHGLREFPEPRAFGADDRLECIDLPAGTFVDGDLYRWKPRIEGFVGNEVAAEWEFFRPQVWPPAQQLSVPAPIVHDDGSVTIDIVDPVGVKSLRHDVEIRPLGAADVVDGREDVAGSYRTAPLEAGTYVARVVGHNSHVVDDAGAATPARAETPPVEVTFTVDASLRAQFANDACDGGVCTTSDEIQFRDLSIPRRGAPITGWLWDFGDGSTSAQQHPTHRYPVVSDGSDTRDVVLTVTDAGGRTSSQTRTVTIVSSPPEVSIGAVPDGVATDAPVTFSATAFDPDHLPAAGRIEEPTLTWDLDGDGFTDETTVGVDSLVEHTFTTPGTKTVRVTATDPWGSSAVDTVDVVVHGPPTAAFTHTACAAGSDGPSCAATGDVVRFDPDGSTSTAGPISAWRWSFEDGSEVLVTDQADAGRIQRSFDRPGDQAVVLAVRDRFGRFSAPVSQDLAIRNRPAVVTVTSVDDFRARTGHPFRLEASVEDPDGDAALAEIRWSFDEGATTSVGATAVHTWTDAGSEEVTVTVTDEFGDETTEHVTVTVVDPEGYEALVPRRLFDSRRGPGVPVPSGSRTRLFFTDAVLTDAGDVPDGQLADTAVVAMNVAVDDAGSAGHISFRDCGAAGPAPTASFVFNRGDTRSNLVLAPIEPDGTACFDIHGTAHVVVDIVGRYPLESPFRITRGRLLDSRTDSLQWLVVEPERTPARDYTLRIPVAGHAGVPADANVALLNVTATNVRSEGYLTLFPCDEDRPNTASVNLAPGKTVGNPSVVALDDGDACLYVRGTTDVVIDTIGHHAGVDPTIDVGISQRLVDTREHGTRLGRGEVLTLDASSVPGIPDGASAAILGIVSTNVDHSGFLTVWPCEEERPLAAAGNPIRGETTGTTTFATLGTSGQICVFTNRAADLVIDLHGWHRTVP